MSEIAKFENLQDSIIELRGQKILLDADVAELYGVETKRINEAVKNNPDKFPTGYVIQLNNTEWDGLKSKFSTSIKGGKVKLPSAFPEKGLYMLAPSLKARRQFTLPWRLLKLFPKLGSCRAISRPFPASRIKTKNKTSCRKAERSSLNSWMTICKQPTRKQRSN